MQSRVPPIQGSSPEITPEVLVAVCGATRGANEKFVQPNLLRKGDERKEMGGIRHGAPPPLPHPVGADT